MATKKALERKEALKAKDLEAIEKLESVRVKAYWGSEPGHILVDSKELMVFFERLESGFLVPRRETK